MRYVGGPVGRWFRKRHWAGVTLPVPWWGAIVLIWTSPEEPGNLVELRHEILGHVPQIGEKGALRYVATVLWQYALYGHDRAPIELDAVRRANQGHQENERT